MDLCFAEKEESKLWGGVFLSHPLTVWLILVALCLMQNLEQPQTMSTPMYRTPKLNSWVQLSKIPELRGCLSSENISI